MSESGFSSAFSGIKKSQFKAAAGKERKGFRRFHGPDGIYAARLTKVQRDTKEGKGPYVAFNYVIVQECEQNGMEPSDFHGIWATENRSVEQAIAGLHWLLQDLGYNTSEDWGADEFEACFADLDENQPFLHLEVVTSGQYTNFRIAGLMSEDEIPEGVSVASPDVVTSDEGEQPSETTEAQEKPKKGTGKATPKKTPVKGKATPAKEESKPAEVPYKDVRAAWIERDMDAMVNAAVEAGSEIDPDTHDSWDSYAEAVYAEFNLGTAANDTDIDIPF